MRLSQVFAETMGAVRSNIEAARASLSRIGPIPGGPTSIAISKLDAALTMFDCDYVPPAAPAPLAPNELQELLGRTVLDGVRAAGIPLASWEDLPANTREGLWRAGRAAWEDGWQYGYSELRVAMGAPGETPDAPAGRVPARRDIGDTFAGVWLALTHARIQAHAGAPASTMLAALETIELRLSALDHRMAPVLDAVDRYKRARMRGMSGDDCALDMQACVGDILRGLGAHMIPPYSPATKADIERSIDEIANLDETSLRAYVLSPESSRDFIVSLAKKFGATKQGERPDLERVSLAAIGDELARRAVVARDRGEDGDRERFTKLAHASSLAREVAHVPPFDFGPTAEEEPIGVRTSPAEEAPRVVQVLTLGDLGHFAPDPARWTVAGGMAQLSRAEAVAIVAAGKTLVEKEKAAIKLVSMSVGETWAYGVQDGDQIVRVA